MIIPKLSLARLKSHREHVKIPVHLVSDNPLPDIRLVITDYYRGAINDVIYLVIRNVDKVMISILSADGSAIEVGAAVNNSGVWSYRAAAANPDFRGGKVLITADDVLGNQARVDVPVF